MPMPPIAKKGRKRASPYAQTLLMETLLPKAIAEKTSIPEFATLAGVHTSTASGFLAKKAREFADFNRSKLLAFTPRHAATLNAVAERQMTIMEQLNAKPLHLWDVDDRKMERHAIACLKAISPFLEIAARALATAPRPQSARESTTESETEVDATLSDGL